MSMLATAVTNLHQIDEIIKPVKQLGANHVNYGVTDKHYDIVGEALIWTLQEGLKDDFTEEVKEAWLATYTTLASVMKGAAAETQKSKKGFFGRLFGT